MSITPTTRNNLLLLLLNVTLSVIVSCCFIGLSGVIKGDRGERGIAGSNAERVIENYIDVLDALWEEWGEGSAERADYHDDIYEFYYEMLKKQQAVNEPDSLNFENASNSVLRSAVDIIACSDDKGDAYSIATGFSKVMRPNAKNDDDYDIYKIVTSTPGKLANGKGYTQNGGGVLYSLKIDTDAPYSTANPYVEGYVLTNYHVISKWRWTRALAKGVTVPKPSESVAGELVLANKIFLRLNNSPKVTHEIKDKPYEYETVFYENFMATVIGGSEEYDVAVLRFICDPNSDTDKLYTIKMGDASLATVKTSTASNTLFKNRIANDSVRKVKPNLAPVATGSSIIAVGNPLGDSMSVSNGIVSKDYEIIKLDALNEQRWDMELSRVVRINAPINPGNSGGGAFNLAGELVGIVNARMYSTGSGDPVDGIAYMLPADVVIRVANQIIGQYNGSITPQVPSINKYNNIGTNVVLNVGYFDNGFTAEDAPTTTSDDFAVAVTAVTNQNIKTALSRNTAFGINNNAWDNALTNNLITISKITIVDVDNNGEVLKVYDVAHGVNVREIMLEAYGKTAIRVTFNYPNKLPVTLQITGAGVVSVA